MEKLIKFFKAVLFVWKHGEDLLRDSLSGLYNRNYTAEVIKKEIKKSERSGKPFCILFIDLDNLKEVNDKKGHLEGDKFIENVSNSIKKNLREMDTASRWGGDEFLILMPDSDIKSAEILKKRIKKNNYSISIGSAVWKKGISFKEIIKKADKEMYREKTKKRLNLKKLGLFYYSFFC